MLEDLDAPFIGRFLEHLETDRGNGARTRNLRLAAIHSFFRYVALNEPAHVLHCQRILAIPSKRHARKPIAYLDESRLVGDTVYPGACLPSRHPGSPRPASPVPGCRAASGPAAQRPSGPADAG